MSGEVESFVKKCLEYKHDVYGLAQKLQIFEMFEDFQTTIMTKCDKFLTSVDNRTATKLSLWIASLGCKTSGKTSNMALMTILFLLTNEDVSVYYISGKEEQSKSVFIKELRTIMNKSKYKNYLHKVIHLTSKGGVNKFTSGVLHIATVSAKDTEGTTLGGFHSSGLQVAIMDEASALNDVVFRQFRGMCGSGYSIFIAGGNPDVNNNYNFFWRVMTDTENGEFAKNWTRFFLNYFDLKRFSDAERNTFLNAYKKDSPDYVKYVLGRYPVVDDLVLLNSEVVNKLIKQSNPTPQIETYNLSMLSYSRVSLDSILYIGIDVAYGVGQDYTVIAARIDDQIEIVKYSNKTDLQDLIEIMHAIIVDFNGKRVYNYYYGRSINVPKMKFIIDGDGIGKSLYMLTQRDVRFRGLTIISFTNTTKVGLHVSYLNLRTMLYGQFGRWIDYAKKIIELKESNPEGTKHLGCNIYLNDNEDFEMRSTLLRQCRLSKYKQEKNGKKELLSKKDLGESPDITDAIAYTFLMESKNELY